MRKTLFLFFFFIALVFFLNGAVAENPLLKSDEPGIIPGSPELSPQPIKRSIAGVPVDRVFLKPPDFDSGWVALKRSLSRTITHNLGGAPADYVVYFQYQSKDRGQGHDFYGGADFGAKSLDGERNNERMGAYWRSLNVSTITLYRRANDIYAEEVRVRIWVDPEADWDSGWKSLDKKTSIKLLHSLGGNTDDYVVYMEFKNSLYGINQMYYGGCDLGKNASGGLNENDRIGAYWYSLSDTSIFAYRRSEDVYAEQVRIRIFLRPSPTYDSGWTAVSRDEIKLIPHFVGGNIRDYIIDLQYKNTTHGINHMFYGGNDLGASPAGGLNEDDRVGAYWLSLNPNSVSLYRRLEDIYAPEVRVRIWHAWKPDAPTYDSLWVDLTPGIMKTLDHNAWGDPESYLVDLQCKSSGDGVNNKFYGGNDLGNKGFSGLRDNERVGAYWYDLDNSNVKLMRRGEDNFAKSVRLRIWNRMPRPDYDSGWMDIDPGGAALKLDHNMGGDPMDYFVDLMFKSPAYGVNHIMYGGKVFGANAPTGMNENDRVGAYWRTLTESSIYVFRRPEDIYAPKFRLRIWRVAPPDYDSDWTTLNPDETKILKHDLYGNRERYLVNMVYFDSTINYMNQRYYGGVDFGGTAPSGYNPNDRVGAYWSNLGVSTMIVYRCPEDGFADNLRMRIWRVPPYVSLDKIREYLLGRTSLWTREVSESDTNGDAMVDIADIVYYLNTYE